MSVDVSTEVVIARPRPEVAAFMFNPSNDALWTTGVVDCRPLTEGALRTGSRVERVSKMLGRQFGYLVEVTCDGTRDVGLFWRDALGWPLVWDENEETAVQSPLGGTKVSWGGQPAETKHGRNRQRLDLATTDLTGESERLVSLGATRLDARAGVVELADPDVNEFALRAE